MTTLPLIGRDGTLSGELEVKTSASGEVEAARYHYKGMSRDVTHLLTADHIKQIECRVDNNQGYECEFAWEDYYDSKAA